MQLVKFLSRFTFICNIAFLLFVFFRWLELQKAVQNGTNGVVAVPILENVIVVLGVSAIIINVAMNFIYFILLLRGRLKILPAWLVAVNFIFLIVQIIYFFL
jgi:hypothetical protein